MRKRFADDGETNKNQTGNGSCAAGIDDNNKRDAVRGYRKLGFLILLLVAVMLVRVYVLDIITVMGGSMNNSFFHGDVVLVEKYDTKNIERYDVVIAEVSGKTIIKRVIGLPGESVQIANGEVFIDGEKIQGDYDFFTENAGLAVEPYALGEDEYFLMGDNRSGSFDSRDFGAVMSVQIKGIVVFRLLPVWRMEVL